MCGFLFEYSKSVLTEKINLGLNALSHRGPDSRGVWENKNIRMGHTGYQLLISIKR